MPFEIFAESYSAYKQAGIGDTDLLSQIQERYTNIGGGGLSIISGGRNGPGLKLPFGNGLFKTLQHSSVFTVGFALRIDSAPTGNDIVFSLSNNDSQLFGLYHNLDGTLSLRAGTGNTLGVSSRALHVGLFYWIDFIVSFGGSSPVTCTAELRINTSVECNGAGSTSLTTAQLLSGTAEANYWGLSGTSGAGGSGGLTISHFYIKNNTGYYGDIEITALTPNGDVITDWTPSTGSVSYVLVNSLPRDLTKFVSTAVIGNKVILDWQDCPGFSGTIKAINIRALLKKDDEGAKSVKIVTGDTGSERSSQEFFVSDVSAEYYEDSMEVDPATGLAWTQAGFNAKRFGLELIS